LPVGIGEGAARSVDATLREIVANPPNLSAEFDRVIAPDLCPVVHSVNVGLTTLPWNTRVVAYQRRRVASDADARQTA
jgi:hypothetical protein